MSTITDKIATHGCDLDEYILGYNTFRKHIVYKFFGNPLTNGMTLAEIKSLLYKLNSAVDKFFGNPSKFTSDINGNNAFMEGQMISND